MPHSKELCLLCGGSGETLRVDPDKGDLVEASSCPWCSGTGMEGRPTFKEIIGSAKRTQMALDAAIEALEKVFK